MTVYLLHFNSPISPDHSCQHYIGFATNVHARLADHEAGRSKARLVEVALERGISFVLARVWAGDRNDERYLKNLKAGPQLCPICNDHPRQVTRLEDEVWI